MWWEEQTEATRATFRKLVKENRLEIVLGGWVMPDEANCDYWAMVDSLIEGHQVRPGAAAARHGLAVRRHTSAHACVHIMRCCSCVCIMACLHAL